MRVGEPSELILVRGVTKRSGTNYLYDLLCQHPDCAGARRPVWEDFFLDEAANLRSFVVHVGRRWHPRWGVDSEQVSAELMQRFGTALSDFLTTGVDARTAVAKSPSVAGLEEASALFPEAKLIVLVRDGRSVAVSAMRSFGWSFDRALHDWRRGARQVLAFHSANTAENGRQYLIVRYEDLLSDVKSVMSQLFTFVGLDASAVETSALTDLPVRGSSTFGTTVNSSGNYRPTWTPVAKDESFAPQLRADSLTASQRRLFDWLAGDELAALGYSREPDATRTLDQASLPLHLARCLAKDRARRARRYINREVRPRLSTAGHHRD